MVKRLGLFVIYDRDGIVDDYISYFLESLSPHLAHLVIVCNGKLTDASRQKLLPFTTDIFVRPNDGYDAGAIKDVLESLYGWSKVLEYDELLICNDTCYGPLFPLSSCFEEMDKREIDFWGMTEQGELRHSKFWTRYEVSQTPSPSHLQSYFINVKKRLLHSSHFHEFWKHLSVSNAIHETISNYEIAFTSTFIQQGYTCSSYVDADAIISANSLMNYNYSVLDPVDLVVRYKCPLIKRKAFAYSGDEDIGVLGNENKNMLVKLIEQKTDYDVNLIWDNLLRTCNIGQIRTTLHMDFILSTSALGNKGNLFEQNTTVVVAYITAADELDSWLAYMSQIPSGIHLVVTTANMKAASTIRMNICNADIRIVEDNLHPIEALLLNCRDIIMNYEYLCVVHDQVPRDDWGSKRMARSYRHLIWENTIANREYIENVLNEFIANTRLGFLTVQQPYHGSYFMALGDGWRGEFQHAKKLEKDFGIRLNLSESIPPFATTHAFWCRTSALRIAFEGKWEKGADSAEALGCVLPNIAQYNGYFSATMASDRYMAVRSIDMERILSRILERVRNHTSVSSYSAFFNEALLFDRDVLDECAKYTKLYIYGAGEYAGYVSDILKKRHIDYVGFIVSNDKLRPESYCDHPVYFLSEIDATSSDLGVILGIDRRNKKEVMPLLTEKGLTNILAFDI